MGIFHNFDMRNMKHLESHTCSSTIVRWIGLGHCSLCCTFRCMIGGARYHIHHNIPHHLTRSLGVHTSHRGTLKGLGLGGYLPRPGALSESHMLLAVMFCRIVQAGHNAQFYWSEVTRRHWRFEAHSCTPGSLSSVYARTQKRIRK